MKLHELNEPMPFHVTDVFLHAPHDNILIIAGLIDGEIGAAVSIGPPLRTGFIVRPHQATPPHMFAYKLGAIATLCIAANDNPSTLDDLQKMLLEFSDIMDLQVFPAAPNPAPNAPAK